MRYETKPAPSPAPEPHESQATAPAWQLRPEILEALRRAHPDEDLHTTVDALAWSWESEWY